MTATNHMITGAAIALAVRQPFVAVPAAFASHFVLDALPHFGVAGDKTARNRNRLFQIVFITDVCALVWLLLAMPFHGSVVSVSMLRLCMAAAYAPDAAWLYFEYRTLRSARPRPNDRLTRFHAALQWGERPWGIAIELAWFAGIFALLSRHLH